MESLPAQSAPQSWSGVPPLSAERLEELWLQSGARAYGLSRSELKTILAAVVAESAAQTAASVQELLHGLRLADLVLARACAAGHEGAWQQFMTVYQEPLTRAAIAITGNDTLGRELAGSLYADLYGLTERDGQRRSPLSSYRGRGSLIGWLRTTLAQRHVDHYRRHHREEPLERPDGRQIELPSRPVEVVREQREVVLLAAAVREALEQETVEERFLVAAYFLDGRKLHEIGRLLDVHEATVSRRLRRAVDNVRQQVVKSLRERGLSARAAEEALSADPRDLEIDLKQLLQTSAPAAFSAEVPR